MTYLLYSSCLVSSRYALSSPPIRADWSSHWWERACVAWRRQQRLAKETGRRRALKDLTLREMSRHFVCACVLWINSMNERERLLDLDHFQKAPYSPISSRKGKNCEWKNKLLLLTVFSLSFITNVIGF